MTSANSRPETAEARAAARKAVLEHRSTEAQKVMAEMKAAKEAEHAKTERLRALRLAKEEAEREAVPVKPKAAKKTTATKLGKRVLIKG
jgi:hypothetical protein